MQSFSNKSNLRLSTEMKCFLNAVTNPFGALEPAQVPDNFVGRSICLKDHNFQYQPSVFLDTIIDEKEFDVMSISSKSITPKPKISVSTTETINGLLVHFLPALWQYGPNYEAINGSSWSGGAPVFSTALYGVTSAGLLLDLDDHFTPCIIGDNYSSIFGSDAEPTDSSKALVRDIRLFSYGLRAWPQIETITSDTTLAVQGFWGGLVRLTDIYKCIDGGSIPTSIYDVVQNSEDIQVFSNSQGCTVRLDPFANADFLGMRDMLFFQSDSNEDIAFSGKIAFDTMPVPTILIQFNQTISTSNTPLPVYLSTIYMYEGVLVQPSPIYSTECPVDLSFTQMADVLRNSRNDFPIAVQGHSFKSFLKQIGVFGRSALAVSRTSSMLLNGKKNISFKEAKKLYGQVKSLKNEYNKTRKSGKKALYKKSRKSKKSNGLPGNSTENLSRYKQSKNYQ